MEHHIDFDTLKQQIQRLGFAYPDTPSVNYLIQLTQDPPEKVPIRNSVLPEFDSRLMQSPIINSSLVHKAMLLSPILSRHVQNEVTAGSLRFACRVINLMTAGQFESTYFALQSKMAEESLAVRDLHHGAAAEDALYEQFSAAADPGLN